MTREEKLEEAQKLWLEANCGLVCPFPRLFAGTLPPAEAAAQWRQYKAYWDERLEKINRFNELMNELING